MKQLHEYAKFFPPMEGEEFKALCQDVKDHGLINPIVLEDDQILDGRNRARACDEVGVRPKYETLHNGTNALDYVISQNVLRRHLTKSQRAILALELEKKFAAEPKAKGGRGKTAGADARSNENYSAVRAAKALRIGDNIVKHAKRLAKEAPEYIPAIRAGKITVKEALIEKLHRRAADQAAKQASKDRVKRRNKEKRQVAQYFEAVNRFVAALKLVGQDVDLFSPEAIRFTLRKHTEIRRLITEFEDALKKAA